MFFSLKDIDIFINSLQMLISSNEDFVVFRHMQDSKMHFLSVQQNSNAKEAFILAPFNPESKPLYLKVYKHIEGNIEDLNSFIKENYLHLNFAKTIISQSCTDDLGNEKIQSDCKKANDKAYNDYVKALTKFNQ